MSNQKESRIPPGLEKKPIFLYFVIFLVLSIQNPAPPSLLYTGFDSQPNTTTIQNEIVKEDQNYFISAEDIPEIVGLINSITAQLHQDIDPFAYSDADALYWVTEFNNNLPFLGIQEKISPPENIGRIPFIYILLGYRLYGSVSCSPKELQLSPSNITAEYILQYVVAHEFGHWTLNHCFFTQFVQNVSGYVPVNTSEVKKITEGSAQIFAIEMLSIEAAESSEKTEQAVHAILFAIQTMLSRQLQLLWIRNEIPEEKIESVKTALGPDSQHIFSSRLQSAENSDVWYAETPLENFALILNGQKISLIYAINGQIQTIETTLPYFQHAMQTNNELMKLRSILHK